MNALLLVAGPGGVVGLRGVVVPEGEVINRIAWDGGEIPESPQPNTQLLADDGRAVWSPPAAPPVVSASSFMGRFTRAELLGIFRARQADATVDLFITQVLAAGDVDLGSAEVADDMAQISQAGLLAPERVDQILGRVP